MCTIYHFCKFKLNLNFCLLYSLHVMQMHYKLAPFSFAIISFYGFSKEETRHMEEVAVDNGTEIYLSLQAYCINISLTNNTTIDIYSIASPVTFLIVT